MARGAATWPLIAIVTAATVAGQGSAPASDAHSAEQVCTLVGCDSGVRVGYRGVVPKGSQVTVCLGGRCVRRPVDRLPIFAFARSVGGTAHVRIVLRDKRGHVVLRGERDVVLKRSQPNGPDCDPVCFTASVVVDIAAKTVR